MQSKGKRGRVTGRVLAKEIDPSASWDNLYRKATRGDLPRGFPEIAGAWLKLDEQRKALDNERRELGTRWTDSLLKWLTITRGKRVNPKGPIGYTLDELLKGAKKDKSRDKEVYRWLRKDAAFTRTQMSLFAEIDARVGNIYRCALETGDVRDLRQLRLFVAEVKLIREGHDCVDPRRAVYLRVIGKDESGQLRRTPPPVPTSWLARALGCDRKTIREWHRHYEITSSQGKPGRPKKSQP